MNPAAQAYADTARSGLTGRSLEAAVLRRCVLDLQRTLDNLADDARPFLAALERNRQCWHLIARAARDEDSDLPDDVRRNLLICAAFVFQRTIELCDVPTSEGARALVEINRHYIDGLEGRGG